MWDVCGRFPAEDWSKYCEFDLDYILDPYVNYITDLFNQNQPSKTAVGTKSLNDQQLISNEKKYIYLKFMSTCKALSFAQNVTSHRDE